MTSKARIAAAAGAAAATAASSARLAAVTENRFAGAEFPVRAPSALGDGRDPLPHAAIEDRGQPVHIAADPERIVREALAVGASGARRTLVRDPCFAALSATLNGRITALSRHVFLSVSHRAIASSPGLSAALRPRPA